MLSLLVTTMLLAGTFTTSKIAVAYGNPLFILVVRHVISGSCFVGWQYLKNPAKTYVRSSDWLLFLGYSFFSLFLSYVLVYWALEYMSSTKVVIFYNLSVFLTPLYGYIFLHERMTLQKWFGLLLGVSSVIPLLISQGPEELRLELFWHISWPELALLIAIFSDCFAWVLMKWLINKKIYTYAWINGITMLMGGSFTICVLLVSTLIKNKAALMDRHTFIAIGMLIIYNDFLCSSLYLNLFKKYTISLIALAGLAMPLFAALYGYILLGEVLTGYMVLSMNIIAVGLYLFYQEELRLEREKSVTVKD